MIPDTESFLQYLREKRIDGQSFSVGDMPLFQRMANDFAELGPASFTQRNRFLLNPLRHRFPVTQG